VVGEIVALSELVLANKHAVCIIGRSFTGRLLVLYVVVIYTSILIVLVNLNFPTGAAQCTTATQVPEPLFVNSLVCCLYSITLWQCGDISIMQSFI
jgi:hypothetical protein